MRPNTINPLAREDEAVDPATCLHPLTRQYAWVAYNGVMCIACCACGAVLRGASTKE